jgi:hypothetical protein
VWGRLLYNPAAQPDQWRRGLRRDFGEGASGLEAALASASRILPIVTTTFCPSAANNNYWPELYLNQSIVVENKREPYTDTPAPKVFGNASPLDPQMFEKINDYADELLAGERRGTYSPSEVAMWLDELAESAARSLNEAVTRSSNKKSPGFRRMAIDISIQAGLGRFFAAKMRAGILYRLYERTRDRRAGEEAVSQYARARAEWAGLAKKAEGVYVADITVGELPQLRGHWLDRLPAIDEDIDRMRKKVDGDSAAENDERVADAMRVISEPAARLTPLATHRPPARFSRGEALRVEIAVPDTSEARLYYRRVNQAERWQSAPMENRDGRFNASIPAAYTDSPFPLEYYFEMRGGKKAFMYPGFRRQLDNQPYFVVRQA